MAEEEEQVDVAEEVCGCIINLNVVKLTCNRVKLLIVGVFFIMHTI